MADDDRWVPSTADRVQLFENLRLLYGHLYGNYKFLRDRLLRVQTTALAVLLVIDAWVVKLASDGQLPLQLKWPLLSGTGLVAGLGLYMAVSHYREHLDVAQLLERVERALQLYEKDIYLSGEPLYVAKDEKMGHGVFTPRVLRAAMLSLTVFAVGSLILLWVVFSQVPRSANVGF